MPRRISAGISAALILLAVMAGPAEAHRSRYKHRHGIIRSSLPRTALLNCMAKYEVRSYLNTPGRGYDANTGNGFYGRYQFHPKTFDGAKKRLLQVGWITPEEYAELAPLKAHQVAPWHQDNAAWITYLDQGLTPWPPARKYCRG